MSCTRTYHCWNVAKDDIATASPCDMEKYYSKEMQQQYGVVGIKISLM